MRIVFDLDGTLFQTRLCVVEAVQSFFLEQGFPERTEEAIIHQIGKPGIEFFKALLPVNTESVEALYSEFRLYEQSIIKKHAILFEDVPEMLKKLTDIGHELVVCSTGSEEYINLVLFQTGISRYFKAVYSAKYVSKTEIIMKSKQTFHVVVGDTISDFQAAEQCKLPSIGMTYGYGEASDRERATFLAQNTEDVIAYCNQLEVFYEVFRGMKQQNINRYSIIGINGVDTSGKSMFTSKFAQFLKAIGQKVEILHIDDYHNKASIRNMGKNPVHAYYENAFCYEQVIKEVLDPLKKQGSIHKKVLCLNLDTDQYENEITYHIDKDSILLIEGVLLYREPLNKYFDYHVFLYIDFEEVLKRAKIRDVPKYGETFLQKYKDKYIPIQQLYMREHDPLHNSDIVIDNQDYFAPKIISMKK